MIPLSLNKHTDSTAYYQTRFDHGQRSWPGKCLLSFQFCLQPLAGLGDGGGRNAQKVGLFGDGELQARKDVGADVSFRESGIRYLKGFRSKIEGVTEHAFQFVPFSILDVPGSGVELFQQVVLSRQLLHKHIRVNIATRTCIRLWNEPLPLVGSGADNHQEGPDILPKDSGYLLMLTFKTTSPKTIRISLKRSTR